MTTYLSNMFNTRLEIKGDVNENSGNGVDPAAEHTKKEDSAPLKQEAVAAEGNPNAPGEETPTVMHSAVKSENPTQTTSNPGSNPGNTNPEVVANPPTTQPTAAPPIAAAPQVVMAPAPSAVPSGVPTLATPAAPVVAAVSAPVEQEFEETGQVSMLYVGRVIGKGGEMIRDLQARSGCRIDVDQNVPEGAPRIITYRGTRNAIDFAKQLISILCTEHGKEAELPLGQAMKKLVLVPSTVIGKIIGRGGEMIRELQSKSMAKIQVDHSGAGMDSQQRQITVTGTTQAVIKAEEMILFLAANPAVDAQESLALLIRDKTMNGGVWGSGPPYVNLPNQGQGMADTGGGMYGGGAYGAVQPAAAAYGAYGAQQPAVAAYGGVGGIEHELYPCSKMYMGRVIGQKGVTINDLQKRSGCDIQINQNVPVGMDCEINIKGSRQGIEMAKQMIQEIIELGPNHSYAGGRGGGDQYGQHGGYQQQAYQQGGYGNQAYPAQSYPPQQQYGMQQQPYGGQQMYQQQTYGQPQMYGAPMPPALTSPWRSATAADGQVYYYNQNTGETQWDKPPGL